VNAEFEAAVAAARGEPLTFDLGGRTWHCRPKLPFGLLGELANAIEGGGLPVFQAFADLIVQAVRRDEREAFREFVYAVPEDDDEAVDFIDVAMVARKIMEQTTGSPFASASGSPAGQSANGATSPVPAGSAASTSSAHRRVKL
jgi:hypothetical protein